MGLQDRWQVAMLISMKVKYDEDRRGHVGSELVNKVLQRCYATSRRSHNDDVPAFHTDFDVGTKQLAASRTMAASVTAHSDMRTSIKPINDRMS